MKKLIITISLVFVCIITNAQTTLDFDNGKFSEDTILNSFILKWLGKPYKLGGKT